jgi:hypothetical protein
MFQTKSVEEIQTHILCSLTFFSFFENRAVYEIMWKNMIERCRPQVTIWRMRIACWINKTTNTRDTYWFSTATVVARTRLDITSYVCCLSC